MHDSALDKARVFREAYLADLEAVPLTILDVGSATVEAQEASNRDVIANPRWTILGMDIEAGSNVDLVVADPYDWTEIAGGSIDVVTCSEVFEHAEFFWVTILEIARVLKVNGLAFVTSPSSGPLHRFPVDCWRFYDDAFAALARYARLRLLESQVQWAPAYEKGLQWRDASAVFQRPALPLEDEADLARRIALGKLLARERVPADAAAVLDRPAGPVAMSVIPPLAGKDAFAARERHLIGEASVPLRKTHLVMRHVREIGRILRRPLGDTRV